jgi:hypothetical protein
MENVLSDEDPEVLGRGIEKCSTRHASGSSRRIERVRKKQERSWGGILMAIYTDF